jgi:hypothetical protein
MRLLIPFLIFTNFAAAQIFIRVNQLGFLPEDYKSAVVISNIDISNKEFKLRENGNGKIILRNSLMKIDTTYGTFNHVYRIDFSEIQKTGTYYLEVEGSRSHNFSIAFNLYHKVVDELMKFYSVQRCGYTDPKFHDICHKADSHKLINGDKVIERQVDVTGGWHDAGDYAKFLNTISFTTYMLLFSYEFDPQKFSFDNDRNGTPDILEEAKIGLDWLLRAQLDNDMFVVQVQDQRDQEVGWRLPENDPLAFDRPAFIGTGKNLIGIYSAALALGSRIWRSKFNYPEFANKCLDAAEKAFAKRNFAPDVNKSGTGFYLDSEYKGKLALGAVELYESTKKSEYYKEARELASEAGAENWWSWGNINVLSHYKLAKYDLAYANFIEESLISFYERANKNVFNNGVSPTWGTNNTLMGISLHHILYERVTRSNKFNTLSVLQRDFILGRNPWGVSFISRIGTVFSRNLHHQIAYLKKMILPGGFAAGPAPKALLNDYKIDYETYDPYARFQTEDYYYRDDRNDYIANEPTITANATAIFVMGYYSNRK